MNFKIKILELIFPKQRKLRVLLEERRLLQLDQACVRKYGKGVSRFAMETFLNAYNQPNAVIKDNLCK